jgi:hypothetical protein
MTYSAAEEVIIRQFWKQALIEGEGRKESPDAFGLCRRASLNLNHLWASACILL